MALVPQCVPAWSLDLLKQDNSCGLRSGRGDLNEALQLDSCQDARLTSPHWNEPQAAWTGNSRQAVGELLPPLGVSRQLSQAIEKWKPGLINNRL